MTGVVFDVKEFAVYDGPGVRTTVFMKGCPLRCQWCHNPEGLSPQPQLMVSHAACTHCGACRSVCEHETCIACGKCIPRCHLGLRKIAGQRMEASALAKKLLRGRKLMEGSGGGVTFSGGEPLMQWDFVEEVISNLDGLHTAIETSGYASDETFSRMMNAVDFIMMDMKLTDPAKHKHFCGVDNAPILRHADMLCAGNTPFVIRVPLIPGVNDTEEHLTAVAERIQGAKALVRVELLPYHKTAGAKYGMAGMEYKPEFDAGQVVRAWPEVFEKRGIKAITL